MRPADFEVEPRTGALDRGDDELKRSGEGIDPPLRVPPRLNARRRSAATVARALGSLIEHRPLREQPRKVNDPELELMFGQSPEARDWTLIFNTSPGSSAEILRAQN